MCRVLCVLCCVSAVVQNPPQVVAIEHGDLPQKCESQTFVGVDAKGNIWAYGGATYANSSAPTANSYCHGVVTMQFYQVRCWWHNNNTSCFID